MMIATIIFSIIFLHLIIGITTTFFLDRYGYYYGYSRSEDMAFTIFIWPVSLIILLFQYIINAIQDINDKSRENNE